VATHDERDFVETNVTGTLILLQQAVAARTGSFVFTSTTSAFGSALTPAPGEPAVWIDEDVAPVPKNIYGVTKLAAESLCELFFRRDRLPVVVLRTSRFFPEADDDPAMRATYSTENAQANELLYRRADIEDVATAHLRAVEKAGDIGFARYIVSATTPFSRDDLPQLTTGAEGVLRRLFPDCAALYERRGWRLPREIDRVYDNSRARRDLGWRPRHDFGTVLEGLAVDADFRSELARAVGAKGYHDDTFAEGPYPVAR
jgi:UDP-glucose 4-epimerase